MTQASCKPPVLRIEALGRVPYGPMLQRQERRHQEVSGGLMPDTLFVLEHPPVITTGRNTAAGHVLASPEALAAEGIEYYPTGRGGDVTYHGPGQLVVYPILRLLPEEQDVRAYVFRLEEICIRVAADFGVKASRVEGLRGIWVGHDKLAAIGVRLARWTTLHGFAINVSTHLPHFKLIVPCGLHDRGVVSLAKILGYCPLPADVQERVVFHSAAVLKRQAVWETPEVAQSGGAGYHTAGSRELR